MIPWKGLSSTDNNSNNTGSGDDGSGCNSGGSNSREAKQQKRHPHLLSDTDMPGTECFIYISVSHHNSFLWWLLLLSPFYRWTEFPKARKLTQSNGRHNCPCRLPRLLTADPESRAPKQLAQLSVTQIGGKRGQKST